jgi:hypothetical protein
MFIINLFRPGGYNLLGGIPRIAASLTGHHNQKKRIFVDIENALVRLIEVQQAIADKADISEKDRLGAARRQRFEIGDFPIGTSF